MNATYLTVHIQMEGQSTDDALRVAKVARQHDLQITLSDGIDDVAPSLVVNLEVTSNSQEIFNAIKEVQKFLVDVTDVH